MENCKLKSEEDNINNVIYNNDTSNYKDITYNKKDETIKALNNASSFIRGELAKRIEIRHIPELKFIYDESIVYGEHIDKIIDKLNEGK